MVNRSKITTKNRCNQTHELIPHVDTPYIFQFLFIKHILKVSLKSKNIFSDIDAHLIFYNDSELAPFGRLSKESVKLWKFLIIILLILQDDSIVVLKELRSVTLLFNYIFILKGLRSVTLSLFNYIFTMKGLRSVNIP